DGAAGGTSLVAAAWLALAAGLQGLGTRALLLLLLCGAIAGFLAWNLRVPPLRRQARVFMGDAGSLMLGFALCWFCIDLTQGAGCSRRRARRRGASAGRGAAPAAPAPGAPAVAAPGVVAALALVGRGPAPTSRGGPPAPPPTPCCARPGVHIGKNHVQRRNVV